MYDMYPTGWEGAVEPDPEYPQPTPPTPPTNADVIRRSVEWLDTLVCAPELSPQARRRATQLRDEGKALLGLLAPVKGEDPVTIYTEGTRIPHGLRHHPVTGPDGVVSCTHCNKVQPSTIWRGPYLGVATAPDPGKVGDDGWRATVGSRPTRGLLAEMVEEFDKQASLSHIGTLRAIRDDPETRDRTAVLANRIIRRTIQATDPRAGL